MAVPRNRLSNARKNKRRAHHAKKAVNLGSCKNCNEPKPHHVVCASCGHYGGKKIFATETASEE